MANSPKISKEMHLIDPLDAPPARKPSRDGFGKALVELGEQHSNIWAMSADVS
jgi:hypothetical protein